jgi:hypothetical protein
MPKASQSGDKPAKETKVKPEKTGKTKSEPATKAKAAKVTKATKTATPADTKAPAKKPAAPKKAAVKAGNANVSALTNEQRRYYVEVAAYYIAERRGFCGSQLEDWVQAEAEIDRLLREGILKP